MRSNSIHSHVLQVFVSPSLHMESYKVHFPESLAAKVPGTDQVLPVNELDEKRGEVSEEDVCWLCLLSAAVFGHQSLGWHGTLQQLSWSWNTASRMWQSCSNPGACSAVLLGVSLELSPVLYSPFFLWWCELYVVMQALWRSIRLLLHAVTFASNIPVSTYSCINPLSANVARLVSVSAALHKRRGETRAFSAQDRR